MPRKTLIEYLDAGARWTGIPAMAEGHPRRRPMRWLSMVALAMAMAGFLATFGHTKSWIGYAILMLGFGVGNFMPIWAPEPLPGTSENVQEVAVFCGF